MITLNPLLNQNKPSVNIHNINKPTYLSNIKYDLYNIFNNIDSVSFGNNKNNYFSKPEKLYLKELIESYKSKGKALKSMLQLDLSRIPNLCAGIDVFKDWKTEDMALFSTNYKAILLQSGCINQCDHCYMEAQKNISTMNWQNFTELVDGMAEIVKRLGFNPFLTVHDNIFTEIKIHQNAMQTFLDADPMYFKTKDIKNGKESIHSIFDAIEYIYKKLGIKNHIITAGWDYKNHILQKGAEKLAKNHYITDSQWNVSIHPFHHLMNDSIDFKRLSKEASDNNNIEDATKFELASEKAKDTYIETISNNLLTLLNAGLPVEKLVISLQYSSEPNRNIDVTSKLFDEIKEKMKNKSPQKADMIDKLASTMDEIEYIGKASDKNHEMDVIKQKLTNWVNLYNEKNPDNKIEIEEKMYEDPMKIHSIVGDIIKDIGIPTQDDRHSLTMAIMNVRSNLISEEEACLKASSFNILYNNKIVGIDGSIYVDLKQGLGFMKKLAKLPFKLNFKHPTNWRGLIRPSHYEMPREKLQTVYEDHFKSPIYFTYEED